MPLGAVNSSEAVTPSTGMKVGNRKFTMTASADADMVLSKYSRITVRNL